MFFLLTLLSILLTVLRRYRFKGQSTLNEIGKLNWREFEEYVADLFANRGYATKLVGGDRPDGGVDVRAQKDGKTYLIQCKHHYYPVGVRVARELLGVVEAEGADKGFVVAINGFTPSARRFAARTSRIALVDGQGILKVLKAIKEETQDKQDKLPAPSGKRSGKEKQLQFESLFDHKPKRPAA